MQTRGGSRLTWGVLDNPGRGPLQALGSHSFGLGVLPTSRAPVVPQCPGHRRLGLPPGGHAPSPQYLGACPEMGGQPGRGCCVDKRVSRALPRSSLIKPMLTEAARRGPGHTAGPSLAGSGGGLGPASLPTLHTSSGLSGPPKLAHSPRLVRSGHRATTRPTPGVKHYREVISRVQGERG